jgi:ornithine carbamoyltransferase
LAVVWTHSPVPATPAVVHSLLHAALGVGMHVKLAHPPGFELDGEVVSEAVALGEESGGSLETGAAMADAVRGAHVVYARSWQSLEDYGNPTLAASRRSRTVGWTVDERLMALGEDARFMHAMPVRRNLEATDEVLDGPRSLVQRQAENRLHSQKALLTMLLR